jgi:hypothetical protein
MAQASNPLLGATLLCLVVLLLGATLLCLVVLLLGATFPIPVVVLRMVLAFNPLPASNLLLISPVVDTIINPVVSYLVFYLTHLL